jgi:exonuclease III
VVWNVRSLNNKCDDVMIYLQDNNVDIAFISETWLTEQCNNTTSTIKSYGYSIIHSHRHDAKGGGTAIVYKSLLSVSPVNIDIEHLTTFEYTTACVKCSSDMKVLLVCVYRTGPITDAFFNDINCLLEAVVQRFDYILIGGDFNIHVQRATSHETTQLIEITSSFNMSQSVDVATHQQGGTIDLLFDNSNLIDLKSLKVDMNCSYSDHYPIVCNTHKFSPFAKESKISTYRDLKAVDREMLAQDFLKVVDAVAIGENFCESTKTFFDAIGDALDNHAPVLTKTITHVHTAPWFDSEYKEQRKLRRKAERIWRKSQLAKDRQLFEEIRKETTILAKLKKQQYYRNRIVNKEGDVRAIYHIVNKEMDRKQKNPLPDSENIVALAAEFNKFFVDKIANIRQEMNQTPPTLAQSEKYTSDSETSCILSEFDPCTVSELEDIISESGIKCSPSDFVPTNILKDNIGIFLPTLCQLVNLSLTTGSMDGLKTADIIPNLKGQQLDPNNLKNYRPISNLTFLGKLVERVVLKRLNKHMDANSLHIPEESAYKKYHSTETISIKVLNDLLIAADSNSTTVLLMLDLSAAFDTVDHNKLLKILRQEINIRGIAFKWFTSFLSGRCQRTRLGSVLSEVVTLLFGVPQGSVLGPVLFNIYIRSLYSSIRRSGFSAQGYADDQQIYKTFKTGQQVEILSVKLQECFKLIQQWMADYCLKLNPTKTQIMVLSHPKILNSIMIRGAQLTDKVCIRFVSTAKSLGIYMDEQLTMQPQVMALKRDCFRLIRNIRKMSFILSKDQLKLVMNSLVVCRLDYCNALYYGINEKYLDEMQRIQNAAGKVVYGLHKHDHIGDTLKDLHWLPIRERITYKILLLVYKSLNGMGPAYLQDMLKYANFNHNIHLVEPRVQTRMGERAFQKYAPKLWNGIPAEIKKCETLGGFKATLKTHLFKSAYFLNEQ